MFVFIIDQSDRFDIGKSTLHDSFVCVIIVLNKLSPTIINWPKVEKMHNIQHKFSIMSKAGLNNIIRVIDCSFIPIPASKESPIAHLARKIFYAITLQAICDHKLRITDAFVAYPGSVDDQRIFKNSLIYQYIMQNRNR